MPNKMGVKLEKLHKDFSLCVSIQIAQIDLLTVDSTKEKSISF